MTLLAILLDVTGIVSGLLAAWFWYLTSQRRVRRISRFEVLDAADINRIVTAINRNNLLNGRAAIAAGASAASLAARFALDLVQRF